MMFDVSKKIDLMFDEFNYIFVEIYEEYNMDIIKCVYVVLEELLVFIVFFFEGIVVMLIVG